MLHSEMIVVKLVGKNYKKEEIQMNSIKVRKWFAIQCINNKKFENKYYEISENDEIEKV